MTLPSCMSKEPLYCGDIRIERYAMDVRVRIWFRGANTELMSSIFAPPEGTMARSLNKRYLFYLSRPYGV